MNLKEIKDAARQAFRDQQTQDTEGGVPDVISFIAGFVEGARYRQDEINELTSVLDLKKETIVEMQNAYETLEAHDEMLIDTVDKLKDENRKLVEALKFYDSYKSPYTETFELVRNTDDAEYVGVFKLNDSEILQDGSDSCNLFSGKLARQVLKEIGEE